MTTLSIPTTSALPSYELVPSTHPAVHKILHRLSRSSLLSLVLDWLDERNQDNTAPYLLSSDDGEDEDDLYPAASSLAALREIYTDLQARKGGKRDVVDRVIEGDWRNGVSLYQLAMADMQYLYDHPASQKWNALKIACLSNNNEEKSSPSIPRFHPATFLRNLQREVLPDVKAHYNLDRHATLPLLILRVFILESPYNTSLALQSTKSKTILDSSKTFYVAFPDSSPHVFVSLSANPQPGGPRGPSSDNKSLKRLILEGIPKAFSKPRERYALQSTSLSARNLDALVERRGGGRTNAAGGGWNVYVEEKHGRDNPLNTQLPTPEASVLEDVDTGRKQEEGSTGLKRKREEDQNVVKRRRLVAQGRFGNTAKAEDGKGIERLDIRIEDPFPEAAEEEEPDPNPDESTRERGTKRKGRRSSITIELDKVDDDDVQTDSWRPDVRVTFHGQHVFAGIRELVEAGIVDGEKMPGWMTGEEGVSLGVVRDGRIRGFKGSGM
jgi:central kinetochore subunit Mis15/CHL4